MKHTFIFLALISSLFLMSCGGDDDDNGIDNAVPNFSFTYEWGELFNTTDLPATFDVTWDVASLPTLMEIENEESLPEGAFYAFDAEDKANAIIAQDIVGLDTLNVIFQITGVDLEEKRYEFASADLLTEILDNVFTGDSIDIPDGVIIPIISGSSEVMQQVGALSFFFPSDFKESFLEITNIDPVTNELSGKFVINWEITEDDGTVSNILKINDGEFSKVPIVQ